MDKKSRNTIIISIVALAIVLITVTYAYFSARITGIESASTISLTAGRMEIVYTEGNELLSFSNIYPREEAWATKAFTLTGYNTTSLLMKYDLSFDIETNTFPNDYLTYDLTLVSSTNGTPILTKTDIPINGIGKIRIGKGSFTNANGDTHNYELKIYFKDSGEDQNEAQGAIFNGGISVDESLNEPDGWRDASDGSLLAAVRTNNSQLGVTKTIPGVEPSASGPITKSVTELCGGENDCEITYFETEENAKTNLYMLNGNYSEVYNILETKWIETNDYGKYYVTSSTSDSIVFHNNTRVMEKERNLFLSAEDDYGTSYYFRGEVDNNYVVFANMCWRIVRIDGMGNIKLVLYNYNPTNAQNPCDSSLDGQTLAFVGSNYYEHFNTNYNRNPYIGYMYSNDVNNSDYSTAHANEIDSSILVRLKSWYDNKFTTNQKDKLADVIWCNDKRVVSDTTFNPFMMNYLVGSGTSSDTTYYNSMYRLYFGTNHIQPSLKCGENMNDNKISKFTASINSDGGYGNGALNGYKIGLLTVDEVIFAGGAHAAANPVYYLYKNAVDGSALYRSFFLLSPSRFDGRYARVFIVSRSGTVSDTTVSSNSGIRPAIALKSDTTISGGVGTASNPFVVS